MITLNETCELIKKFVGTPIDELDRIMNEPKVKKNLKRFYEIVDYCKDLDSTKKRP